MRTFSLLSLSFVAIPVAVLACGGSPPPESSSPPTAAATTAPTQAAIATSAAPAPSVTAPPAERASAEKTSPETAGPQIEVIDHHEPPFLDYPGPACDGALHEPMPGKDRQVPLRAKIGAIQMNGRANHADVARAVQTEARGGLTKCADLAKNRLDEHFGVKVSYDALTATTPTASDGSGKSGDALAECVVKALTTVRYPKPEGGTVTMVIAISYTKTEFVPADKAKLDAWAKRINAPCKSKK